MLVVGMLGNIMGIIKYRWFCIKIAQKLGKVVGRKSEGSCSFLVSFTVLNFGWENLVKKIYCLVDFQLDKVFLLA